ncbi:hypothetical protein HYQ46_004675 [Verticillium longisporum]|nr:hypothetical protein HYQ46_004675 [Verticillium longisporum]
MVDPTLHARTVDATAPRSVNPVLDCRRDLDPSVLVFFLHCLDVFGGKFANKIGILAVHLAISPISRVLG